jgi:hypothetical protein
MNINYFHIKDGRLTLDMVSLPTAIEMIWWDKYQGIHHLINSKGSSPCYDLYGTEVVKGLRRQFNIRPLSK